MHYYNEHNAYRAAVLRERMDEGLLPKGVVDEPNVGQVAHGVPKRVDRVAALGDAIVPQCAAEAVRRFFS